ncbi:MFS transporter [soil metagenome]
MSPFAVFAVCSFASGFAARLSDPIVLPIALHFGVEPATSAMLSVAYAVPYAVAQPFLGPLGDRFGKERCIQMCVACLALALLAGVFATSFAMLIATRIFAGLFAAGLTPLILASLGDRYELSERQVMIGRMLFAVITGQMLGSAVSGVASDLFGWRSPLVIAAVLGVAAAAVAFQALKSAPKLDAAARKAQMSIRTVYATIFANPRSLWLYGAVAVEGALFFGPFPFMGTLLVEHAGTALSEAGRQTGLILGATGVGGLAYALTVRVLMARLGSARMSIVGSTVTAVCFVALALVPIWWLAAIAMGIAGMSFFMMHSSMQTYATELVPSARATAVSLFACGFFCGQGFGPIYFGPLSRAIGFTPTLIISAVAWLILGRVVVRKVMH